MGVVYLSDVENAYNERRMLEEDFDFMVRSPYLIDRLESDMLDNGVSWSDFI